MICSRVFDFVTGTEIVLPAPPCRAVEVDIVGSPRLDFLRPDRAVEALIEHHGRLLMETGHRDN